MMGFWQATFVVVASMLGPGILSTSGLIVQASPDMQWALLAWLAGGIQALLGALCYGALIARMPLSGGEGALLGRFYSPHLGLVVSLLSFILGFAAANAATAMALEAYFQSGMAHFSAGGAASALPPKSLAVGALLLMTGVHCLRTHLGMRFQTGLAIVKFSTILLLALAGLWLAQPGAVVSTLSTPPGPLGTPNADPFLWLIFTYSGWNAGIYAAREFARPESTVPRAMLFGCALVMLLYLLLNLALAANLGRDALAGQIPVAELLVTHLFGSGTAAWFSLLIALALLSSIGAIAFAGPRVLHAALMPEAAERGTAAPLRFVLLQGLVSVFFVLSGSFEQVLSMLGFFLGIFPVLTVAAIYFPRYWRDQPHSPWIRFLVAPIYLAFSLAVLLLSVRSSPLALTVSWGLLACALLLPFLRRQEVSS